MVQNAFYIQLRQAMARCNIGLCSKVMRPCQSVRTKKVDKSKFDANWCKFSGYLHLIGALLPAIASINGKQYQACT
jgi:hypothetical protein